MDFEVTEATLHFWKYSIGFFSQSSMTMQGNLDKARNILALNASSSW